MRVLSLSWWFAHWRSLVWPWLEVREKNVGSSFLSTVSTPRPLRSRERGKGEGIILEFSPGNGKGNERIQQGVGKDLPRPCTFTPNITGPI